MSSRLREELKDREYRDAYVAATVRNGVAFQIRAMRESRGWDQKKLATKMGNENLQPIVSRYENPDYGRFTVSSLLDLAKAFDVGLVVRFAPFSELINRDEELSAISLDVASYAKEQLAAPITPGAVQLPLAGVVRAIGPPDVYQTLANATVGLVVLTGEKPEMPSTAAFYQMPGVVNAFAWGIYQPPPHAITPLWQIGETDAPIQ
jgi:transcriptional regulator with XRE-family HTH domain